MVVKNGLIKQYQKTKVKHETVCETCDNYTDQSPCANCGQRVQTIEELIDTHQEVIELNPIEEEDKKVTINFADTQKIFCYGTLKKGYPLHFLLGCSPKLIGYTSVRGALLIKKDEELKKTTTPYLFIGNEKIEGEVYEVDAQYYNYIKVIEENAGYKEVTMKIDHVGLAKLFFANPRQIKFEQLKKIEKF